MHRPKSNKFRNVAVKPHAQICAGWLFFFMIVRVALFGQANSNFDHFTVKDGLPSGQIYNCFRDQQGFLWIGTDAGVSRFDGKTFKNFNVSDGLGDNDITEVYQDRSGRIWFIPFSGKLSYYYKGKIHHQDIEKLIHEPSRRLVNHALLGEDSVGNLFISRSGGTRIIKLSVTGAPPKVYDLSGVFKGEEGFATFFGNAKNQACCITSRGRLILLGDSTVRDVTPARFVNAEQATKYYINHRLYEKYVLFSGKEGIYRLQDSTSVLLIPNEILPVIGDQDFIQVQYDNFNNLWIDHLQHNTLFYKFSAGRYLAPVKILNTVFSVTNCYDEHSIWFATSNGLYRTTYAKLQDKTTFDINQNLMAQKVISCAVDIDSALWLGYSNGYVSRIKGSRVDHYNLKIGRRTDSRIVQIKVDKKGNVFIGTDETAAVARRLKSGEYEGPSVFHDSTGTYLKCSSKTIFFNSKGQAFLSDAFTRILLREDQEAKYIKEPHEELGYTARRYSAFFDRHDRLYTSTLEGFPVMGKDSFTDLALRDSRFKVRIKDYAEASDGTIFLAYNNGVMAMKDNKFVGVVSRFNNQSVICRRIYLRNDTLYAATNCGIAVLTFHGGKFNLLKMLSVSEGLISQDVNDLAFLGKRLFAATSNGISSFELAFKPAVMSGAPTLVLQSIQVDDRFHAIDSRLKLSYKTQLIRINFIAPVLDRPELTLYRYRFNDADKWQVTSANFIEFSKLKPGKYTILIQAKKYNSAWSTPGEISFTIEPPFYNTFWFIGLAILALAACLYFIIKLFLDKKFRDQLFALQQKEAIEQERNRIAADLHDDIGGELTNIAILSQVLKHTMASDNDKSLKLANKIEASSNQIITKMNEVIWTLNAGSHTLKGLVSHTRNYVNILNEDSHTRISMNTSDDTLGNYPLTAELTRNIFLVIKEMLQNAIKHSWADTITLNIRLQDQRDLCIEYTDNGIGFEADRIPKGNGLVNIRRRAAESQGTVNIVSELNQGCQIKVIFPINHLHHERQKTN